MSSIFKRCLTLLSLFCLTFICATQNFAQDKDWREVTPSELQMKTSKVEPDADAEAIFGEVRVDDSSEDLTMKHYIRVKIFTERGREKFSKIDIPYFKGMKVKNISARVIKTDGSIVELTKADVFEREIAKANDVKIKAKSFAVPNIEPGVIFEYRYQEVFPTSSAEDMRMIFQRDIPIQDISYYFKPIQSLNVKYLTFNLNDNKFVKDKGGFYRASMTNVPALKDEPRMPPEDEVRSWMLLYYDNYSKTDVSDFWGRVGGRIARVYDIKDTLKPGKDIKTAAADLTRGATTDDEKLARLFEFCQTKIKNVSFEVNMTDEEKELVKPNKSSGETYKKLQGRAMEINELFASLAVSLNLETRLAFAGDRSKLFFNPQKAHESFVHPAGVGVKVNNQWRYFDPGSPFVSSGMLPWFEEDTAVFLLGYKDYMTTETPLSGTDKTAARRSGKFKLLEDGTLEGTVKIEYTGHLAYRYKMDNYDKSANKREENLKEEIKARMSTAEISDVLIENANAPAKPFVYQFKVRVPNYAQKTGKRLFLQPGFFEYGETPVFSTAGRKHDIFFNHPWSETDSLTIELPKNFALDNADTPAAIADSNKISALDIKIKTDKDQTVVIYERNFFFGGGGHTLFPVAAYQPLKNLFDSFHKADTHTITLKQK